jgi:hypothetical protein
MLLDYTYAAIYGILYKLADEFDDEEIYSKWFPYGKTLVYTLFGLFTFYILYFTDNRRPIFLYLISNCIWYILIILAILLNIRVKIIDVNKGCIRYHRGPKMVCL